jgi:hypothetical protein
MNKIKKHIIKYGKDLFRFDKFRLLQIIEIIQSAIITYFFMLFISKLITLIQLKILNMTITEYSKYVDDMSIPKLTFILCFDFAIYSLVFFYIVKILKVIPSISNLFDNDFEAYETMEYVIEIVMLVLMVEVSPILKLKLERLYNFIL